MSMRSLERSIIRSKCGSTNEFREAWKKYHDAKMDKRAELIENGGRITSIRTKPKKKKRHYDNGKLLFKQWIAMKEMIANMAKEKQNENTEVVN